MAKINELTPIFCVHIPEIKEEGKLYISEEFEIAIHLCACGCGRQTITPLSISRNKGWTIQNNNGLITLRPSIGNFKRENPYHAHYYITNNKIEWL